MTKPNYYVTRRLRKRMNGKWFQRRLSGREILQPCQPFVHPELYVRKETSARTNIHRRRKNFSRPERQRKRLMIRNFLTPSSEPSCVIRLMYLIIGRCVGLLTELNSLYAKDVLKLGTRKKIV